MVFTHIDLFSGLGGFAYAAQQVWPDYKNLFFCDNNKFCQEVLKKNFGKEITIYDDIRKVTANGERSASEEKTYERTINIQEGCQIRDVGGAGDRKSTVDLLTGGFPCQPFSQAGRRKGTDDNRYLWPEMLRVISEFHPRWVIAENVRGLLSISGGMVFEQVCLDLESAGYEVWPVILPAVAVNAPHRRDRVWFIAHSRCEYGTGRTLGGESGGTVSREEATALLEQSACYDGKGITGNAKSDGKTEIGKVYTESSDSIRSSRNDEQANCNAPDPDIHRLQEPGAEQQAGWDRQADKTVAEPTAMLDGMYADNSPNADECHSPSIATIVSLLPTPATRDWKGGTVNGRDTLDNLIELGAVKGESGTKTGLRLQPNFVAWMMGFQSNWANLNCPSQNIEKNSSKPTETP